MRCMGISDLPALFCSLRAEAWNGSGSLLELAAASNLDSTTKAQGYAPRLRGVRFNGRERLFEEAKNTFMKRNKVTGGQ